MQLMSLKKKHILLINLNKQVFKVSSLEQTKQMMFYFLNLSRLYCVSQDTPPVKRK